MDRMDNEKRDDGFSIIVNSPGNMIAKEVNISGNTFNYGTVYQGAGMCNASESETPTMERLMKACEKTQKEGYWWANASWSVVFAVYMKLGYKGSASQFIRDVNGYDFTAGMKWQCNDDSVTKNIRERGLMEKIESWDRLGVPKPYAILAKALLREVTGKEQL